MKTWMRRRGDRVKIITGKYAGHTGVIESNVYQKTADCPDELNNGFHFMLDTEELITVRWDQVESFAVKDVWVRRYMQLPPILRVECCIE